MTAPHGNTPDGSSRIVGDTGRTEAGRHGRVDTPASGTTVGANVHERMTGNSTVVTPTGGYRGDVEHRVKPAKTSAAATFALVFGLAALFCALTAILAPAAVLFGIIGIVLGIAGLKMAKKLGVTGKGVALGGLITSVLGLLLGGAVMAGAAFLVNSPAGIDRAEAELEKLRNNLPSSGEVRNELPAG
jgi:hypothetical protein